MLAHTIEDTAQVKFPALVSQKLDGIRCLIVDGVAMSRSLKPIRNEYVQSVIGKPELNGLDGELIVGDPYAPDCYRVTNSGVMSKDGEPDFFYHIFDRWDDDRGFADRYASLLRHNLSARISMVPHRWAYSEPDLLHIEQVHLEFGAEGVMVRSLDGPYKQGRSTMREGILGKLKRMSSDEAEVICVVELEHNMNPATINALGYTERSSNKNNKMSSGTMGSLSVKSTSTGAVFNIGTGFSSDDRSWFWANRDNVSGLLITYNHFPIGRKDLPRFPAYKGIKDRDDL
jgi:DNA ligase-1